MWVNSPDPQNHLTVFRWNASFILWELALGSLPESLSGHMRMLAIKLENSQYDRTKAAIILKDIGAFLALYADPEFQFDGTEDVNFYEIWEEWNRQRLSTDTFTHVLKTVCDAEKSLQSEWEQPPFSELQKTADIRPIVCSLLNKNKEWKFASPEEAEFFSFIDALRERVWDDYDANNEIDRIMSLTDSPASKIVSLQNSKILKPFISRI